MKSNKIVWGLLLVFAGIVTLLDNFGVIDFNWGSVWRLWPLLLIVWGAELAFSGRKNAAGPWIVAAITLAILIFAGYYGSTHISDEDRWMRNFRWHRADRQDHAEVKTDKFSAPFSNSIRRAELNIEGGATTYRLVDSTSNLFDAEIKHQFAKYSLTRTTRDSTEVLSLKVPDSVNIRRPHNFNLNKVEMQLNTRPLWNISLEMGAGQADFDLSRFRVASLNIEGGAASFEIKIGELSANSKVTVHTGVSKVKISVPASSGCLINIDSGLSSNSFKGFTKQDDGTYITDNYNSSAKKITINLEGGVSDFEVRRY
jgi:hypothetical protein